MSDNNEEEVYICDVCCKDVRNFNDKFIIKLKCTHSPNDNCLICLNNPNDEFKHVCDYCFDLSLKLYVHHLHTSRP